jgi:molecular chaperone GrpE
VTDRPQEREEFLDAEGRSATQGAGSPEAESYGFPGTPGQQASGGRQEPPPGADVGNPADPVQEPAVDQADGAPNGDQASEEAPEQAHNDLAADLATAQSAVGALTQDLKRLQAEYVNYKRRVDRDRELVKENAAFSVLSALMPVLDDLDRAREHGELEGGFKAVADSLERIVAAQGLVKFGKPGDEFDPRLHEALMHSHSPEVTTTTCQQIVSAGYRIGDRVVRPARVIVVDPEPDAG